MSIAVLLAVSLAVPQASAQEQSNKHQFKPNTFSLMEVQAAKQDPDAFTVDSKSIRIVRLKDEEEALQPQFLPEKPGMDKPAPMQEEGPGQDPFVVIDQIINIYERVWSIIEKNKPVVNVAAPPFAAAVPQGITSWEQLQEWKDPKTRVYGFYAKNLYGVTVIDVKYQVQMTYGGNYKGKGKFLTGVTVIPLKVDVAWGYKFSMDAAVPSTANIGTSDDPVAAMIANLHWQISSTIKDSQGTSVYNIKGTGAIMEIGGPFKQAYKDEADNAVKKLVKPDFVGKIKPAAAVPVFLGR